MGGWSTCRACTRCPSTMTAWHILGKVCDDKHGHVIGTRPIILVTPPCHTWLHEIDGDGHRIDPTEAVAYGYMESLCWPDGPVCPHCRCGDATHIQPANGVSRKTLMGAISRTPGVALLRLPQAVLRYDGVGVPRFLVQSAADTGIAGDGDRWFCPDTLVQFEVLLDPGMLLVGMDRRGVTFGDDPGVQSRLGVGCLPRARTVFSKMSGTWSGRPASRLSPMTCSKSTRLARGRLRT